jgi:two-component system CheB/CheR fusion protein
VENEPTLFVMSTARHPASVEPPAGRRSLRIFVVENHPDTLLSLRLYLEDLGHVVLTATTRHEALEALPSSQAQVLISDIGLPDGTGWDLLQQARLRPEVFAIAMSGFGTNADSDRSRQAGFRHHLLKPFKADELDRLLEEADGLIR